MKKRALATDLDNLIPHLIGVWRRFHKLAGPSDVLQTREFRSVVEAVQKFQKGLLSGKELAGKNYFSDPQLLGAYLLYYWVVHYQEGLSLINEIPTTPRRVLDICSGPAPYAFAALRHGAEEVIALDKNEQALKLGAEICGRYGFPLTIRSVDCLREQLPIEGKFDLIIVGHCLEELFPDTQKGWQQRQKTWINRLLGYLKPDGYLLISESSLLPANKRVLSLREELVKEGQAIQAPCVWRGECPALQTQNNPCYAQREFDKPYVIKEIQRAAQINLSSLKMSYLIVKAPQSSWPTLPPYPLYRVISPAIDSDMGKRYYLCGTDGKKSISSSTREHPPESRAFDYLKRGELISIQNAIERQSRFEITIGTQIKVEAAIGKPLPESSEN